MSRKLFCLGCFFITTLGLALTAAAQTRYPAADEPRKLFDQGLYSAAYAAFWPSLTAGDPEAAFYALIIRRNGLDSRPPAAPAELAALWNILSSQADRMRQYLNSPAQSGQQPESVAFAYRTALAQLEYFGPQLNSWPPPMSDPGRRQLAVKAVTHLQRVGQHFTPAMNFMTYLDLAAHGGREGQAFNRSLKAAEKGDHLAMANVSWLYRQGLGTDKNHLRAAHWARRAAGANPPPARALNEVGFCYESGHGVSQDPAEALRWYEQSAAQKHPAGQENYQRLKKKSGGSPALDDYLQF